jgi:RES domain-containing protein
MFGTFSPERQNSRGARWNPPETPAIYTSLTRETVLAEADYYINLQPFRPRAVRKIYRIDIALHSVLDLSSWESLASLGIDRSAFSALNYIGTQMIGGAAEWLKHDGILVPSARGPGINLVIFPNQQSQDYRFQVLDVEELPDSE